MRCLWVFIISTSTVFNLIAQPNLIVNSGLEDYILCDGYPGNIPQASSWANSNLGSSDWFNTCISDSFGVPINEFGYQWPQQGIAYSGIAIAGPINYREGILGRLDTVLEAGSYYCFERYLSIADTMKFGINEFGVYFSIDSVLACDHPSNNNSLPYQLKLDVSNILDTATWHLVTGGYLASGGEKFITISVFTENLIWTQFRNSAFNDGVTYYYLDNLSLTKCTYPIYTISGGFSPNDDGINDVFEIQNLYAYPQNQLTIINRWGDVVYKASPYNNDWNGTSNTGMNITNGQVTDGTYFYVFIPSPGDLPVKGSVEVRRNN